MRGPERLELPNEFPVAERVSELDQAGKNQRAWWYDVRRVLQAAVEGMRGGKRKLEASAGVGTATPTLGTTAPVPATNLTPHTWVEVIAPDGTVCTIPLWKKV